MGPDQRILDVVVDHRSTGLDTAMRVVTEFGSFWVLWLIGIAVTIVWWRRFGDWLAARVLAITAGTAWASSNLIKWIVDRDRPPLGLRLVDATGSAFPSGHSTQSAAMYGAIAVLWVLYVMVLAVVRPGSLERGWASLIAVMVFLGGVQLVSMGMLGQYVSRIFEEGKRRPLYLVHVDTKRPIEKGNA